MTEAAAATKAPVFSVMKADVMAEACKHYGLKPERTVMATAAVLRKHFAEKAESDPELLMMCTACNGASLSDYACCPYCGDAGESEPPDGVEAEAPEAEAPEAVTEIETSAEVVEETSAPAPAAAPKLALVKGKGESVSKSKEVKESKAKAEQIAKDKAVGKAKPPKPAKAAKAAKEATTAIVKAADGLELSERESALDKIMDEVRALKQSTTEALWKLGDRLRFIKDNNLWHERKDEKGAPKYRVFSAFVKEELGLEKETAYSLMEVSQTFTADQVEAYGMEKCRVIVGLPEDLRKQKAAEAAQGSSVRELRDSVRTKRGGASEVTPGDVLNAVSILVRVSDEPIKLPLFKATARGGKKPKPAEALSDKPWCEEHHENGTVTRYMIVDDGNALQLVITRRRGE
jgi:hypothetical protein